LLTWLDFSEPMTNGAAAPATVATTMIQVKNPRRKTNTCDGVAASRLVSTTSSSRSGEGRADHHAPKRVEVFVRALTALVRVTRKVRLTSTHPRLGLRNRGEGLTQDRSRDLLGVLAIGLAVHAPARRLGRLTSTTRSPAAVRARVRVAPNDPVLSTPVEWT
jgi:hypothetical protein